MQESTKEVRLAQWSEMIIARNNSGLSVRDWCRQNGISEKTFHYRQKKVREQLYGEICGEGFAEIGYARTASFVPAAVLKTGNITLELSNEVTAELLEKISGMLRHAG